MMKIISRAVCVLFVLCCMCGIGYGGVDGQVTVDYKGTLQEVPYFFDLPESNLDEPLGVFVCVWGLSIIDGEYVHSETRECVTPAWYDFAAENHLAILGVGFLFMENDWPNRASYQYPQAWSGEALLKILEELSDDYELDTSEVYMYGVSAGAQYTTRFALMRPEMVKAVTAHAGGSYDLPERFIPTKFLLTVGELDVGDVSRVEWAEHFYKGCQEKNIDIEFHIIPEVAHRQTEEQNEMSRKFITKVRQARLAR